MQEAKVDNMIRMARQKHDLMEEFLALSQRQSEAINQEDYELLLAIVEQKQNIIGKVELLKLELQDQMPENNGQLLDINRKTKEIISQAAALDKKSMQLLKSNQDQVVTRLINIQKSKRTHAQYRGDNVKMEGMLLDIKQ
jgi:hypothetical protein